MESQNQKISSINKVWMVGGRKGHWEFSNRIINIDSIGQFIFYSLQNSKVVVLIEFFLKSSARTFVKFVTLCLKNLGRNRMNGFENSLKTFL